MKVALVGGGGFRTPLSYAALLGIAPRVPISDLVLHDVVDDRLALMQRVLKGLSGERPESIRVRRTSNLEDAVDGADFVLCAIRVGGLEGRAIDEGVPASYGVLGQETVGAGGIGFALRTVPVMLAIAATVARRAPQAWFVNFTNPVGMTTEAIQAVLGGRAIGVCDTPSSLCRRVAGCLDVEPGDLWFDYFGLNHLGWLRAAIDGSGNRLPELLADDQRLAGLEETALFGAGRLRCLGMVPNEYLYYYEQQPHSTGEGRARYLLAQQNAFYAANSGSPAQAYAAWRAAAAERDHTYMAAERGEAGMAPSPPALSHREREPQGGYADVAAALIEALACNTRAVLVLNVANHSSLRFLDASAVVEVPCVVGAHGASAVAVSEPPAFARELISRVKGVERLTIEAALSGSASTAIRALSEHPLVPSVDTARHIFRDYCAAQPLLAARFRDQ